MHNFTVPNRTIMRQRSEKGVLTTFHLTDVLSNLSKMVSRAEPEDFERPLSDLEVSFRGGHMRCRWQGDKKIMLLSDVGASQLQQEILPGHFFKGLRKLALLDEEGAAIAGSVWRKFANLDTSTIHRVRTIKMKVDKEVYRVVRSVTSMEYAAYSNVEFVKDILDNAGDFANLPVLDWWLSDNGMRIRFAAIDDPTYGLMHFDTSGTSHAPLPMIEVWNSEVKRRSIGLRGGMFKLICSNGMCHWSAAAEKSWIHRGDRTRIQDGVRTAFRNLITTANQVCQAYSEAADIELASPVPWMSNMLGEENIGDYVVQSAVKALKDPTTTPGLNLASIIDAITLVAQDEADMYEQERVEKAASRILQRGRDLAKQNGGVIPFRSED